MTPVTLDTAKQAGDISRGGVFTGTTCGLTDDYAFPDVTLIGNGATYGDCTLFTPTGPNDGLCPVCDSSAASDCSQKGTQRNLCSYSGLGSPDAVFYLALPVDSGVDVSTLGSNFDTQCKRPCTSRRRKGILFRA